MKRKKITVLIIEKSLILRRGLSAMLLDNNKALLNVEHVDMDESIEQLLYTNRPNILIVSPRYYFLNEKILIELKEKLLFSMVGLVYSYVDMGDLSIFDGLIYLNDTTLRIEKVMDELAKSQVKSGGSGQGENDALTGREKEILKLLVNGNTTKLIANNLNISTHTVNAHRKNIMRKLDIKTVSGLTIYAVLNNIISLKEA